ncbi:MAG: hypothetical protein ACKVOU_07035 [Cytophagales bacterium]
MKKHFINFIIFSSAVLITKVCYDFVMFLLPIVRSTNNPYYDVLIGMALQIILFLPLYNVIFSLSEKFMNHYIKASKKTMRQEILALILGYLLLLLIVFVLLLKMKFGLSAFEELAKFISHKFQKH